MRSIFLGIFVWLSPIVLAYATLFYSPSPVGVPLPLPAQRDASANWKMAGLQSIGGIPVRSTQCGSTVTPIGGGSDDTAAIQAAIDACTAGQFVNLGSGTFTIAEGGTIHINKGVSVRGQGPGVTILEHPPGMDSTSNVCNAPGAWGATVNSFCPGNNPSTVVTVGKGTPSSAGSSTLGVDAAQGTLTIQVASTSTFTVGGVALVYELAISSAQPDTAFNCSPTCSSTVWASTDYRYEWNVHNPAVAFWDSSCLDGGTCGDNNFSGGTNGDECAYSIVCGGVNEELHLITAIGAGPCPGASCTLTFDSPVMQSYRTANTATAIAYAASSFATQAGLEKVSVAYGDNGNISIQGCIYCWTQNVESYYWLNGGGVGFFQGALRDQMESTWVHNAAWPSPGGGGYAVNSTYGTTEDLIWNSIVLQANKTNVCRASCAGSVAAYNFMDDSYIKGSSWAEIGLNASHLIGPQHMLFEGNRANNGDADFTHGNTTNITYFRNYFEGYRTPFVDIDGRTIDDLNNLPGGNGPLRCFSSHPYSYWFSYIGNICGISGAMSSWTYKNNQFSGSPGPTVLKLGWNDSSVSGAHADDVAAVEYPASPSGVGVTAPGCVVDADPCTTIVDGNYDYLTNTTKWATNDTSHVLANSLYLSAAPTFFTSGTFGGPYTWPPIDSITPTINNIPAFARWNACSVAGTITPACIFTGVASYAGPGDVVASATAWYGLRAYTAAVAATGTQKSINIKRASDSTTTDILILTNGALDTATAATFCASTTCTVQTWYDQTGNGHNATIDAIGGPTLLLSGCSSGSLACLNFDGTTAALDTNITGSQPQTISFVGIRTGNFTSNGNILRSNGSAIGVRFTTSTNTMEMVSGLTAGSIADNAWHAGQFVYNHPGGASSSVISVDGVETTGDPGALTFSSPPAIGAAGSGGSGEILTGHLTEVGLWASAISSGNRAALNTNQHSYWGF